MKRCKIYLALLIFSIAFWQSMPLLSVDEQTTVELLVPTFGSTDNDLPEGPAPGRKTHYKTFTFDLELPEIANNDYIDLIAELEEVTKYEGSCANYDPGNLPRKEDLLFHESDYPQQQGGWKYVSWKKLTFRLKSDDEDRTVPTQVSVRCYDWGAYGKLTLTFKKKIGFLNWETLPHTHSIPMDTNKNQIGDGWQSDATENWINDRDDEHVPQGNVTDGDGRSVYDEYRGVFLQPTDFNITRLDPTKKDVMICSEAALASYDRGSVNIPHHEYYTIHEDFVDSPWAEVHDNQDITKIKKKLSKDIGQVNKYSKGERGHDRIPGYEDPAWAIRLTVGSKRTKFGDVATGSPSHKSKVRIFKTYIEDWVEDTFDNFRVSITDQNGNKTQAYLDAVDVVINVTISHEIGHSLAQSHCTHANCLMRSGRDVTYDFDPKTQVLSNDTNGIDAAHDIAYAATGVIAGEEVSDCGTCGEVHPPDDGNAEVEDLSPDCDSCTTGGCSACPQTPTYSLTSSDGIYTAEAGTGHEANFTTNQAYSYVYWYVRSPSESSGLGTNVKTDTGDSSTTTTAQLSYSFPSGVSGDYVITAYVYGGDNSVYETSYTVSVSLPTPSTPPATVPVWSNIPDPYNLTVGDSFSLDLSSYVTGNPTITWTSGWIPAGLSFSNGVLSGTVSGVESRSIQWTATNSAGSAVSEWVQIVVTAASTPTVSAPVWSDIPDPYNLTVGDSFYLDLSSYVTGSPTFTRNSSTDGGPPSGTSLSNGIISGTVRRVQSRVFRILATNSAGTAYSEWISITVTAAQ